MNRINYFSSPIGLSDISDFLNYKYWTTFEVALIFTNWPKFNHRADSNICRFTIKPLDHIAKDIIEDRSYFYLTDCIKGFDPKNFSEQFQVVFKRLVQDIDGGKLSSKPARIEPFINHVVNPMDAILWALKNEFELTNELQNALGIVFKKENQQKPWHIKVKRMIVGQSYHVLYPRATRNEIISSTWMQKYAQENKTSNEIRQIQKDLQAILGKGKSGRRKLTNVKSGIVKVTIKAIPEVLRKHKKVFYCDFALLDTAISTAIKIKIFEVECFENILKMNLFQFMNLVKNDKIIKVYLKGAPEIIVYLIEEMIIEGYSSIEDHNFWSVVSNLDQFKLGKNV